MLAGKDSDMPSVNQMPERNILSSWKEIATYVGKERPYGSALGTHFPLARPPRGGSHGKECGKVAFRDEIDSWLHSRFKAKGQWQHLIRAAPTPGNKNAQLVAENKRHYVGF